MSPAALQAALSWQREEQAFLERCAAAVAAKREAEAPAKREADDWFDDVREEAVRHQAAAEAEWAAADEEAMWADGPRAYCRRPAAVEKD